MCGVVYCLIIMSKISLDRADPSSCYHQPNSTGLTTLPPATIILTTKIPLTNCYHYLNNTGVPLILPPANTSLITQVPLTLPTATIILTTQGFH